MKDSPYDKRILERMAPGVLCAGGFLGTDRRSLGEIIDTDRSTLAGLGVSQERLAARMKQILDAASAAMGGVVEVGPGVTAVHHEAMGRIPSPFGEGQRFAKGEVDVIEAATGEAIRFTPLSVHLIAEQCFFQGRGSRYRLEPDRLCSLLGLAGTEEPEGD